MRPIKFRVQNKHTDKWEYFTLEELVVVGVGTKGVSLENWCEFTGLLDKNGKEIFEGDFLIDDDSEPMRHRIIWDEWNAKWEIETLADEDGNWESGLIDYLADQIEDKITPRLPNFEVIGNLYENPELLKS